MNTNFMKPLSVEIGTEFFLVEKIGTRQIMNEVVMESNVNSLTNISEMTENDYIIVKNKLSEELIELVRQENKNNLVIKGKRNRVSFMVINQNTLMMKKLSDEENNAIEQRKDLARVAKAAAAEAAERRKEIRESKKSSKNIVDKKIKLENIKNKLIKRLTSLKEDLENTENKIKNIDIELSSQ